MSRTDHAAQDRVAQDLVAAAAVHAAREEIVQALGPLAASPLDEQAAARMRRALERVQSPAVRRSLRRLTRFEGSRPPLVPVPTTAESSGAARHQAPPATPHAGRVVSVSAVGGAA